MNLWIKNGHIVDPATGRDEVGDVYVVDGKIADAMTGEYETIDASGKYVMPGFVDLHVHLREPGFEYKETIKTGTMAAAKGGFTGVCPMPNTKPATDSPERIRKVLEIAEKDSPIHVYPVGAVTVGQAGETVTDIEGMVKAGAKAISEDGKSVMNAAVYEKAMKEAARLGIPVMAHCEDKNLVGKGAMNAGKAAERLGIPGITNAVEDVIVARDILLAKETGAKLHLCHCSTADSVTMIQKAKEDGVCVSGEVCPHHFSMTEDDILEDDANYKMNPPLRTRKDVDALIEGLKEGYIQVISTDHAPHTQKDKTGSMRTAAFGIVGIETSFALSYTALVETGVLTLSQLVEKMSYNPAKILNLPCGTLQEGHPADVVIADIKHPYTIHKADFVSKGKNTPFEGKEVKGKILYTICDGKVVYTDPSAVK